MCIFFLFAHYLIFLTIERTTKKLTKMLLREAWWHIVILSASGSGDPSSIPFKGEHVNTTKESHKIGLLSIQIDKYETTNIKKTQMFFLRISLCVLSSDEFCYSVPLPVRPSRDNLS